MSPHRLSSVTSAAGNGNTNTPPIVAPVPVLPNVGIEINDVQQGERPHYFLPCSLSGFTRRYKNQSGRFTRLCLKEPPRCHSDDRLLIKR